MTDTEIAITRLLLWAFVFNTVAVTGIWLFLATGYGLSNISAAWDRWRLRRAARKWERFDD